LCDKVYVGTDYDSTLMLIGSVSHLETGVIGLNGRINYELRRTEVENL
jgi:hypothetical protein